ncbi:ATP F0F1 synthase subunit C, partial [Campylobacter jejuni]|nr:ATP F0F1 synthase subunit C [Campylobacter jejuni]
MKKVLFLLLACTAVAFAAETNAPVEQEAI